MKERLFDLLNQTKRLRQLFVLFTLVLIPIGAWAGTPDGYGIWIGGTCDPTEGTWSGGTLIDEDNCLDVFDDGTVSFNSSTNTLTLKNATISSLGFRYFIANSSTPLNIELIGNNTINTSDGNNAFYLRNGESSVTVNLQSTTETKGSLTVKLSGKKAVETGLDFSYSSPLAILSGSLDLTNGTVVFGISYDLTVGGVAVTSANASAITGENITGTVSYSADSNTLTLSGATINNYGGISCTGDLNLSIIGESVVTGTISSSSQTGATLTFKHGDRNAANLTYRPDMGGEASGFTSVVYDGMYLTPGVYNDSYQLTEGNSRNVKYSPTRQRFEESEGSYASPVKFTSAKNYDLWLGSTKVTDANMDDILGSKTTPSIASFNPDNNTLTLNGLMLSSASIYDAGIISRLGTLTIVVNGENVIECGDSCSAIRADMEGAQTLTIAKGSDNSSLVFSSSQSIRDFNSLTLTGMEWNNSYTYGLDNTLYNFGPGYRLMESNGVEAGYNNITNTMPILYGTDVEVYDLWVAGTQVTSSNAQSIEGRGVFSGTVSYDDRSNTLTLNNAEMDMSDIRVYPISSGLANLKVKLIGSSHVGISDAFPNFAYYYGAAGAAAPQLSFETEWGANSSGQMGFGSLQIERIESQDKIASGYTVTNQFGDAATVTIGWATSYDQSNKILSISYIEEAYSLWIGDTQVTATNAADVLKDKKVSFTSYIGQNQELVNILTLNDATITVPIKIGLDNLTIDIQGTNTITTNTTCIQKMENTDPSLTFRSTGDEVGSLILTHNGGVSQIGNVTISRELIPMLTVYGTEDYTSNMYYFTDGSTSMVKFLPSYGVKVGDTQIYSGNANDVFKDGTVKFDQETGTLTLSDASVGVVSTSLANLTIELEGNNMIAAGSSMATLQSMYGDPVTMTIQSTGETKGCLTMNQPYTSEGTFADEHVTLNIVAPLGVVSGSLTGNKDNDNTILIDEVYGLTVNGVLVTYMNKDNILNDKTASVRFNPVTSTLSLYGANITTAGDFVRSSLAGGLTVDLHGSSTLNFSGTGTAFISEIATNAVALKFTTDASNPGQLSWTATGSLYTGFAAPTYESSLELQPSGTLISVTPVTDYALTIGTTVVNSVNCTDVLGDGKVKYIDDSKTLVLDGATITDKQIKSGLDKLTIHLLGDNTIENTGADDLLVSTVAGAPLKFTTTPNIPGKLTLTKNTGAWITGFADPTMPSGYTKTEAANNMYFSLVSTIKPLVVDKEDGQQPEAKEEVQNPVADEGTGNTNTVINNVLYTVPKSNDSFETGTSGNPDAVCLSVAPTDTELSDAQAQTPGTPAFAAAFTGLTFEIPAGTGVVKVEAEIDVNAKMAVKIGSNAAELFPKSDEDYNKLKTYEVPYEVKVPTYVYVYLAESTSAARSDIRGRGKVLMGHVKVTTVGAASNTMVMDDNYSEEENVIKNEVKLFALPEGAEVNDGKGIVLSMINVDGVDKSITEIAPIVFKSLDKDKVRYIDLAGTAIKDFTVNRSSGMMSGFGSNTLFFLPAGNDDGGENNVVIDGTCATLSLADDNGFCAPKDFTATKALLNREFTATQTSTIFLPFALSKSEADALGTFHTFDKIENGNAKFNEAETNGTEANKPYIFVPKANADNVSTTDVTVEGFGGSNVVIENMIGTYEKKSWASAQENIYGFAAADLGTVSAGQFVRVDAGAWIPPFRAYLMVNDAPSRLNVVIAEGEGETTDLKEVKEVSGVKEGNDNSFYSISGQRVSKPAKGLYIINGKKVLVK